MRLINIIRSKKNITVKKIIFLLLYKYCFRFFPKSTSFFLGSFSKKMRYLCCKRIFKFCGIDVNIERGADFGSGFDLEIGDYSGIGINCRVPSNIKIGNYVMMGPNCYILDTNHDFSDLSQPMIFQGHLEKKKTIIKNDVWIGRDVVMTPGRIIEDGTIIGACTLLSKDFPAFSIVGGNPSKLIRFRNE